MTFETKRAAFAAVKGVEKDDLSHQVKVAPNPKA